MTCKDWKYYNHAVIPTCDPYDSPDLLPIQDGSIWEKTDDGTPLLARWTSDFDCSEETEWWYCIREAPFLLEELSSKNRQHIRQALKKSDVRKNSLESGFEELFSVYSLAYERYEKADNKVCYSEFCKQREKELKNGVEFWCAYLKGTDIMAGYMSIIEKKDYAIIIGAKFVPEHMHLLVSDAIYATVLDYYLNIRKKRFISSGERAINHITNTQDYKEKHFGYRKAYCRLHVVYNPKVKFWVYCLFCFRKLLYSLDKNTFIHQINSVLKMEEIVRHQKSIERRKNKK